MNSKERRRRMAEALAEYGSDPTGFVIFEERGQPDNFVQFACSATAGELVLEVSSRDYDGGPDALPRLTEDQIGALVSLGFQPEANPNYQARFKMPKPAAVAELCDEAFAVLGAPTNFDVVVTPRTWMTSSTESSGPIDPYARVDRRVDRSEKGAETLRLMQAEQRASAGYDAATGIMGSPYVVTCAQDESGSYSVFAEPELLIYVLTAAVEAGDMTSDQALEAFHPYRDVVPFVYEPQWDEEELVWPFTGEDYDAFESTEVYSAAMALGIPDVGYNLGGAQLTPMSGRQFEIIGDDAMRRVKEGLRGEYTFVRLGSWCETWAALSPERLQYEIRRAREAAAADRVSELSRVSAGPPVSA
ncbi:MAG TPA: hypothetical protein VKX16_01965 [Chloroflexota bacterium]|nr:hypothetical protein [Chloroflexota bacterium]